MSTPRVILTWDDNNNIETGHKIYRSNTSMNLNSLPDPIVTLGVNSNEYIDLDVIEGNFYYYIVSAYTPTGEEFSEEIMSEASIDNGAGPQELIAGDMTNGFFGEILSSEFITGDQLATSLNLTQGISQYSDTPWLKFVLDDEIIYIPKKPIRHSVSWQAIYQAGAVYGTNDNGLYPSGGDRLQDAMVSIGNDNFKVTLLKGGNSDPVASNTFGYDIDWTHQSEWNRLMYPVHSGIHTDNSNPSTPSVPYAQWASYSDEDLLVHNSYGDGSYSWCQEQHPGGSIYRVIRGYNGVTYSSRTSTPTAASPVFGFRPALRLVR